jgi:hypothetical protein
MKPFVWLLLSSLHLFPCSSDLEIVPWEFLPGRPLLLHSGKKLNFEALPRVYGPRMSFHRAAQSLEKEGTWDSGHVEQYIIRVERGKRSEAQAQLRSILNNRRMHYLPMDAWVIAMSGAEAAAAQHVYGAYGVYKLPADLKVSQSLLSQIEKSGLDHGEKMTRERERGRERSGEPEADRRTSASPTFSVLDVLLGGRNFSAVETAEELRRLLSEGHQEATKGVGRFIRNMRAASPEKLSLDVHSDGLALVARWLSHMQQVVYVEQRPGTAADMLYLLLTCCTGC